MQQKTIYQLMVAVLAYMVIGASPAYAYLDPGTGSMILQGVLAAVLGSLFFIKSYWHRAVLYFKSKKEKS